MQGDVKRGGEEVTDAEQEHGDNEAMNDSEGDEEEEDEEEDEVWTLVADTSSEWEAFADRFRTSKNKPDRVLHNYFKVVAVNVAAELRVRSSPTLILPV